ncbi:MAG: GNAT family N-acetyltransferase [Clostridia bacterium]|nr:GNAT family N-acetyltransferase [Clostridia bacterium]
MSNTVYERGKPGEMPRIIDFINYVFSQAHVPHDFKRLLPKVYGDEAPEGQEDFHFLAKQGDQIVGCVALRPTHLVYGGQTLNCGFVGSVSVHPYHRGEGHMKRLMEEMLSYARQQRYDMLILGGQRQRYEYFGFEKAGLMLRMDVSRTNVRHALADVDISGVEMTELTEGDIDFCRELWQQKTVSSLRERETFMLDLKSWNKQPKLITSGGEKLGYIAGGELLLKDESALPKVIKKLLTQDGTERATFVAGLDQKERIAVVKDIAEYVSLGPQEMVRVLNWEKVLKLFLEFKHRHVNPVENGSAQVDISGEGAFGIHVDKGEARVERLEAAPEKAVKLDLLSAQKLFFGVPELFLRQKGIPQSWQGLPFYMSEQDCF